MPDGRFYFEGDLSLFLLPSLRGREVKRTWSDTDTLMHVIESIGVPHTEVARIERDGSLIRVYPRTREILQDPRFVLDQHLGRLAAYLRMLGFDVLHTVPAPDQHLAAASSREDRVLLTRDVGLLKRKEVRRGYFVRATDPRAQLLEVLKRFGLVDAIAPFTRCFLCNTPLESVDKAVIARQLPERIADLHNHFMRCPSCGRVYWKGSHYDRMRELIEDIKKRALFD
uniref:Twitching motility protein PilT n=1 Tax=Solibacter usitatus (strain Ellin6076) TaxID=234267 RepID=Q02CI7_SOLUE